MLGASRWRIFWTVTVPASRYGLMSAAFIVFAVTITDFGNAIEIEPSERAVIVGVANDEINDVSGVFSVALIKKTGETWSKPKAITDGSTDQNMFAVLVIKAGLMHTVFRQAQDVY